MRKFTLPLFFLFFILISNISFSQSWLPEPVKSPIADALTGTWASLPYEFTGHTNNDVVTYKRSSMDNILKLTWRELTIPALLSQGKEIVAPKADGTLKGTYYDIFGNERSSSYSSSGDGSKIILTSASLVGTGTREIIIDGDTMIQNVTFSMSDKSGNPMPEQKITITYKKDK